MYSSASFDAGLADLPFTISPVCVRIVVYIITVFVQIEIACLILVFFFCYCTVMLFYSVQGLAFLVEFTTEPLSR